MRLIPTVSRYRSLVNFLAEASGPFPAFQTSCHDRASSAMPHGMESHQKPTLPEF